LLPAALLGADAAYLIELGAGAGLNLYAQHRGWEIWWEEQDHTLEIGRGRDQFRVRASGPRPDALDEIDCRGPEALGRSGADAYPIDLDDPDSESVLRACIWGDHDRRMERLLEGLAVHRRAAGGELHPAKVEKVELGVDLEAFLARIAPREPIAPVISFSTFATAYLSDVKHREVYRTVSAFARNWSVQHGLPWMWVRFEPARPGDTSAAPHTGWCHWLVELWDRTQHKRIDLGWAHPHMVRVEFGDGLRELQELRTG
jgi:hypothetical protein